MINFEADREALLQVLRSKSVFFGDFVLSSGARSDHYFDCKLTTLDPKGIWLVGRVMHELIAHHSHQLGAKIESIGGLTMGADPIALAVGMVSFLENESNPLRVFIVRKEAKHHGQNKLIEGNFSNGDKVVVIDDVVTRGDSTLKAVEAIRAAGGIVVLAAVLVDREEGGRQKIEAAGVPVVSVFRKSDILEVTHEQASKHRSGTRP